MPPSEANRCFGTSVERVTWEEWSVAHVRRAAVELLLCAFSTQALGGSVESAVGTYREDKLEAKVASLSASEATRFWQGEGRATSIRLGATGKQLRFIAPANLLKKQLDGEDEVGELSLSAGLDQGFGVGTTAGALFGGTKSKLSDAKFYGLRLGQWFRSETLQTTLDLRRTDLKQAPIEFTDTDGKRIRTPADLHGNNVALGATHFTTPTTILRGSVSVTDRSDRPLASAVSGEVRQFIAPVNGVVHFAMTHYENVGAVDDTQQVGSIVANNARLEWHQRLFERAILMGGYRYYLEVENPRAPDAENKQIGSDALYTSLRYRFGDGSWTDEAPEAYLFASRYNTNVPTRGHVLGFGGRWNW